jgi:hypothetical protein
MWSFYVAFGVRHVYESYSGGRDRGAVPRYGVIVTPETFNLTVCAGIPPCFRDATREEIHSLVRHGRYGVQVFLVCVSAVHSSFFTQ